MRRRVRFWRRLLLPIRQGSEKQVVWAEKLRVTMTNKVVECIKTAKDYNPACTFKAPNALEMARRVKLANKAKFWIDNRDNAKWIVALPH